MTLTQKVINIIGGLLDFYDEDVYKRKKHNTPAPLDKLKYYTKVFPSDTSSTDGVMFNHDEDEENINNTNYSYLLLINLSI